MNKHQVILMLMTVLSLILFSRTTVISQSQIEDFLPLTAWGDPDLQGIWDFRSLTPMERPNELAGKQVLTDEEAAIFVQGLASTNWDSRENPEKEFGLDSDIEHGYNQFWMDFGTSLTADNRTALVTNPSDGRIPWRDPNIKPGGYGDAFSGHPPDGPEDRPLAERCLMGFNAGPPMIPSAYNNNVQLLQTPLTIVIFNEMINTARIVPMDTRPHLPPTLRQWAGSSRGYWEGNTLVVKTSNFLRETHFEGSSANLELTERFTRTDPETLIYEFTVEDSEMWTEPWTASVPMTKTNGPIYEYACHEGNYGMFNILAGARNQEMRR
tara:strand:- start:364 stop:1338 length:975 start_codon:yes stop_codon:yes gene_type:complete